MKRSLSSLLPRSPVARGALATAPLLAWLLLAITTLEPGELGVRFHRWTGGVELLAEGPALVLPGVHRLSRFPLKEQLYRPAKSARADAATPFQSIEGLRLGVELTLRYSLDPEQVVELARRLPEDPLTTVLEPEIDAVLHRVFATHSVREIFSSDRARVGAELELALREVLAREGMRLHGVQLGAVDLPPEYRAGLEAMLAEELSAEKMRFTLELKEKLVKQSELEAEADKVRRERAAEAAAKEELIAARSREEAMRHVLPFREREIEARRLEAEAGRVARTKQAQGEAEARVIEAQGEAEARRKLADAEAYRLEVTGRAASEQMARDSALIARNPLLIQKALADKLSDKIQVIIAPPDGAGFVAQGVLGRAPPPPPALEQAQAEEP